MKRLRAVLLPPVAIASHTVAAARVGVILREEIWPRSAMPADRSRRVCVRLSGRFGKTQREAECKTRSFRHTV